MPIDQWQALGAFSEAYEVVRTFVLVGHNQQTYRVEIMLAPGNNAAPYQARFYRQEQLTVQLTYPVAAKSDADELVWVADLGVPHADGSTEAECVVAALKWLASVAQKTREP